VTQKKKEEGCFSFARRCLCPIFMRMFKPADLFDLSQTQHDEVFEGCEYAWDALKKLKGYVLGRVQPDLQNQCEGTAFIGKQVSIGKGPWWRTER